MPYHKLLDHAGEAQARQAPDRHHPARHRPLLRRQGGAARHPHAGPARREDPAQEDLRGARAQAADAAAVREGPRARPAHDDRGVPHPRPPARALHRRHAADRLARARPTAASWCSRARRAPCSTSTTAPIRSSPRRTPSRARPAPGAGVGPRVARRGLGDRQGLRHARRAPARSRPSSTTSSASASARPAASSAPPPAAPRRTGWLDLVALRYATRINGLTGLVLTKLDVLTGIDPLYVGVRYLGPEGATLRRVPLPPVDRAQGAGRPVELPGWHEDISRRALDRRPAGQRPGLPRVHLRLPRRPDRDGRRGPAAATR